MNYQINLKNLKQSARNLEVFLKEKDINISHAIALESIAKIFQFKNWNTIEANANAPTKIEDYNVEKRYVFEIKAEKKFTDLLNLIKKSLKDANCQAILENCSSKNNHHRFELNMKKDGNNIITFMIVFCNELIKQRITIESFDYCRIDIEKQSFMKYIDSNKIIVNNKSKTI